jgi:glycogen operon protein
VVDDSFLMAFNAHYEDIEFTLPGPDYGQSWGVVVDTATGMVLDEPTGETTPAGQTLTLGARSMLVLQHVQPDEH